MSIRQAINDRPGVVSGVVIGLVALSLSFAVLTIARGTRAPEPRLPDKAYYTADDGVSLFPDTLDRVPPYDHDGKPAVRAFVFKCDGAAQWVQYLEKYSDADKGRIEAMNGSGPPVGPTQKIVPLVKRPGAGEWIAIDSAAAHDITQPKCPDGGAAATIELALP